LIPVYPLAGTMDNVNFASQTIWEGAIKEGGTFRFHPGKPAGVQFIGEGADLRMIADCAYDFVLSSHMLEHSANPLGALAEWRRVLKPGGALILVVPHRDGTFDHRRPVTTFSHLVDDFTRSTGEDDLTHVEESLDLHDPSMDPDAHGIDLRERAGRNLEFRALHHHVFDTQLVVSAVEHAGFELSAVEPQQPYHVVVVARRPADGVPAKAYSADNLRSVLRSSPFLTDRNRS